MNLPANKLSWEGKIVSVQPRIRLIRSFDERSHNYMGYALRITGTIGGEDREFSIGVGIAAQAKHQFKAGDVVSGESLPVMDDRREPVEFYKTSKLRLVERGGGNYDKPPPWLGTLPTLETYRARGHRRLAARTYSTGCSNCLWGCRMPVEMIIDHWNPSRKRYRFETFCYGPKSCPLYRAGHTRQVPGRKGMVWEEEDWVDEQDIAHRSLDE